MTIHSAKLKPVILNEDESFFIGIFQDNLEKSTWHYHNNYEISFITEGSGKRIVADSIEDFQPGDLVFLGPHLPHVWIADKVPGAFSNRTLEMVFLQFNAEILTTEMLKLPEFRQIEKALAFSERGIHILGQTLNEVSELMLQLPYLTGFNRMLHFLRILDRIGASNSLIPLASKEYQKARFETGNKRLATIHNYLMSNYRNQIDLKKLASEVHMAEGSLCRFFRQQMGITIFEYLNKIKIELACKLLMNPDLSILDVCLDSGFNNISHFNKQFRKYAGKTPTVYRKQFNELK